MSQCFKSVELVILVIKLQLLPTAAKTIGGLLRLFWSHLLRLVVIPYQTLWTQLTREKSLEESGLAQLRPRLMQLVELNPVKRKLIFLLQLTGLKV